VEPNLQYTTFFVDSTIARPPRPKRSRSPSTLRKIYIKTGLTPPASGSAYLELEGQAVSTNPLFPIPSLKLSCTVHGPRPLPRSAPYSPHLALTCHIKYTPYASRNRRGYVRDASERDLTAQLETALRAVILGERYPKTGVDVVVTVLEGEGDEWIWGGGDEGGVGKGWGAMGVLAGCVTVAGAALVDAGVDLVDLIIGGVAAVTAVDEEIQKTGEDDLVGQGSIVLDPSPVEHETILAACVVGYIASRDEMSLLWLKGSLSGVESEKLIDAAVKAAQATRRVLVDELRDATLKKLVAPDKAT